MKTQSIVKTIAIDLDDAEGEAEHALDVLEAALETALQAGVIEEANVVTVRNSEMNLVSFEAFVKAEAGHLHDHDNRQKREARRMIYGDDTAGMKRASTGGTAKAS